MGSLHDIDSYVLFQSEFDDEEEEEEEEVEVEEYSHLLIYQYFVTMFVDILVILNF